MGINEIIEYLRTLPEDAIVKVSVMDKRSEQRSSTIVENVIEGGVWCREDIGTLIEEDGKEPTPENIDRVLDAVSGGLDTFGSAQSEDGWDTLHDIYDGAIEAL